MKFVKGKTLAEAIKEAKTYEQRLELLPHFLDLCNAIRYAHSRNVIHRDIKSQNVMRAEGGRILLMDFGAGRDVDREQHAARRITGTAYYMAPQVLLGEPATRSSDIYSLGVLLYNLVTRTFPVRALNLAALREKHRRREARLLRDERPDLPEQFIKVVERALAWNPQDRYATAGQMEQALRGVLGAEAPVSQAEVPREEETRRPAALRPVVLLAAAAVVVAGVVGILQLRRPQDGGGVVQSLLPGAATYNVEATLHRVGGSGRRERLAHGAQLDLGDALSIDFEASKSVYLYVINEDEAGHAYALFPLPDLDLQNPLAPGVRHRIPGDRQGTPVSWTVDTPGGREHLLVLASPERLIEFEAEMNALVRPRMNGQPVKAVALSDEARIKLRGLGGLVHTPDTPPTGSARQLFEMADRLASRSEAVEGVWMRQIELVSPAP
jgi:hypothetical protein